MPAAVIIPVRGFRGAKERLAGALAPAQRARLAEVLLRGVMAATDGVPILVVSSDPDVARVAAAGGATTIDDPAGGLDAAVQAGVAAATGLGYDRVVVAHGDLPFPAGLDRLAGTGGIVLVPDRHRDGTNVISVAVRSGFRFSYGPASFDRHLAEARRLGVEPTVIDDSPLGWDVDVPDDLATPPEWGSPPWARTDA